MEDLAVDHGRRTRCSPAWDLENLSYLLEFIFRLMKLKTTIKLRTIRNYLLNVFVAQSVDLFRNPGSIWSLCSSYFVF